VVERFNVGQMVRAYERLYLETADRKANRA
jgi:hypothetical protein